MEGVVGSGAGALFGAWSRPESVCPGSLRTFRAGRLAVRGRLRTWRCDHLVVQVVWMKVGGPGCFGKAGAGERRDRGFLWWAVWLCRP